MTPDHSPFGHLPKSSTRANSWYVHASSTSICTLPRPQFCTYWPTHSCQPTSTHHLLNLLSTHHLLLRLFTQNIDTLEHLTGLDPTKIVEAHGSFASSHCLTCGKEASREYVLSAGVRQGEVVRCAAERRGSSNSNSNLSSTGNLLGANEKSKSKCGGLIKPDIVFFGEGLPDRFFKSLGVSKRLPSPAPIVAWGASFYFTSTWHRYIGYMAHARSTDMSASCTVTDDCRTFAAPTSSSY